VAYWLEHGPDSVRLETIAFAVTLAGEMVVDRDPGLAIAAAALAKAVLLSESDSA